MDKLKDKLMNVYKKLSEYFEKHKKLIKLLGRVVSIVAVVYVIYTAYTMILKLNKSFLTTELIFPLIIIVSVTTVTIFVYSYSYYLILKEQSQKKISVSEVIYMYGTSNIYKYLPSNVMHYVGRNMLAKKYDIEQKKVLKATILEIVNVVVVTIAFCLVNYLLYKKQYIFTVIVFVLFLIVTHRFKLSKNFLLIFITTTINNLVVVYLYNFYNGTSILGNFEQISIIQSVSWLAGFVVPGAPGGIGIKEFVMVKIGTKQFSAILPIVAVMQRLILIAGDFIAYAILQIKNKTVGEKYGKQ
ncbi:MAG: hypothetical protein HFI34_07225 [Lachnospiraceae bacterium]|nr:hypothetical protein [Lachnospiraceae bacterium]